MEGREPAAESTPPGAIEPVPVCPDFRAAIELIGKRWSGAIVRSLSAGPLYFADLAHAVPGLSDRVLSQRLRELEGSGVIEREVHPGPPARVSYCLTEMGGELEPALSELTTWARRWDVGERTSPPIQD